MNNFSFENFLIQNVNSQFYNLVSEFKKTISDGFFSKAKRHQFPRGSYLVRSGEIAPCIWYLESGIAHVFFEKEDLKITQGFIFSDELFCIYCSSIMKSPSIESIQLLSDSLVTSISWNDWNIAKKSNSPIDKMEQLLLAYWLHSSVEESIQRFFTVKERYYFLYKRHPQMINNIPSIYLADYLGTTPETISRIRSKTNEEKSIPLISPFEYLFEKKAIKKGLDGHNQKMNFQR